MSTKIYVNSLSTNLKNSNGSKRDNIKFSRDLIKGRIAETVFTQMIRDGGQYDVIPFGYEHTIPSLIQYQHLVEIKQVMKNIKDAPDFVLISKDKKRVFLVEVKYRARIDHRKLQDIAKQLLARWNPSWLFLASPKGFFFAPCDTIISEGKISHITENWVSVKHQDEYLKLLNEFEKK